MSYDCPQCHSPQTASFEMMHAQGTQSGNISASTVTFGGDIGLTTGQFNSQTVLAGRLSPPVAPAMGCGIQILIGIGAGVLGVFIGGGILEGLDTVIGLSRDTALMILPFILIVGFLLYGLYFYNRFVQQKKMPVYREQLQEWSNSMICRRCGYMWVR
jgi:Zn-dependent protease with chaperone function